MKLSGAIRVAWEWLLGDSDPGSIDPKESSTKPAFECSCDQCANACRKRPGWFMPEEAEMLASRKGIPFNEFFRTQLVVDIAMTVEFGPVLILMPAMIGVEPGGMGDQSAGQCAFFIEEQGLCGVHSQGKPYECALATHEGGVDLAQIVAAWLPYQGVVQGLLGDADPRLVAG